MQLFSILLATFYGNFYQFLRKMQKVCFEKYTSKLQYFSLILVSSLNCVTTSFVTYWFVSMLSMMQQLVCTKRFSYNRRSTSTNVSKSGLWSHCRNDPAKHQSPALCKIIQLPSIFKLTGAKFQHAMETVGNRSSFLFRQSLEVSSIICK